MQPQVRSPVLSRDSRELQGPCAAATRLSGWAEAPGCVSHRRCARWRGRWRVVCRAVCPQAAAMRLKLRAVGRKPPAVFLHRRCALWRGVTWTLAEAFCPQAAAMRLECGRRAVGTGQKAVPCTSLRIASVFTVSAYTLVHCRSTAENICGSVGGPISGSCALEACETISHGREIRQRPHLILKHNK